MPSLLENGDGMRDCRSGAIAVSLHIIVFALSLVESGTGDWFLLLASLTPDANAV